MEIQFENRLTQGNWAELSALYLDAGLGNKSEERLKRVFGNSQYQSFLYVGDELAGAARAFSDDGDCAVVCDVSILKKFQGMKLGFKLMEHLMNQIPTHQRIMLFCTPGLESFYEKFGFGKMTTGMCRFLDQQLAKESGYIV